MPVSAVPVPDESSSFLRSCLVEGDSAQEARVRRNKRRALFASIVVQILFLTALVLFPLFSKGENIASRAVLVPAVPYSPGPPQHPRTPSHPTHGSLDPRRFFDPLHYPDRPIMHDPHPVGDPGEISDPNNIIGDPNSGNWGTVPGGLTGSSPQPPPPPSVHPRERLRVSGSVIAAMLIRRIQPIYPPLAMQIRREGKVELHAIIATDGTVQSLEVVNGDPLFIQSALSAVREWRYRPTILNGQPIEVDTQITVIYTLNH
jgi:periplasmic protein TonB